MRFGFNLRSMLILVVGVLVVAGLVFGGIWGYSHVFSSPDALLASAQKYYDKGEEARKRYLARPAEERQGDPKDLLEAKKHYEYADVQLQQLLDEKKDPNNARGWLLRHRVLVGLYSVTEEQKNQADRAKDTELSKQLAQALADLNSRAWECANQASGRDPKMAEAHGLMLDFYFLQDDMRRAVPFAQRLLACEADSGGDIPEPRLAAAHYVLALEDLKARTPRADSALAHMRAVHDLAEQRWQANGRKGEKPEPRWREITVEAEALRLKVAQAKKTARRPAPRRPDDPARKQGQPSAEEQFRDLLTYGLNRVQKDLNQPPLPADGKNPEQPYLCASLSRSPTNARGLFDFLLLALAASEDREQTRDRVDLGLRVCEQVAGAPKPPELMVQRVTYYTTRLPSTITQLPAAAQLPAADWQGEAGLGQRLEKVADAALAKGPASDPSAYLSLASQARKENRFEAALKHATDGLAAAQKRGLKPNHPAVLSLHEEAAWLLILLKKPQQAEEHLAKLRGARDRAPNAHLMLGLAALMDGRLEQAVQDLLAAQQNPRLAETIYPHLGLAAAYLGLGKYDKALAALKQLDKFYQRLDSLTDEEAKRLRAQFMPSRDALDLEQMRCLLALGRLPAAQAIRERLKDKPEGRAADLLLIAYYADVGRKRLANDDPLAAGDAFDKAAEELKAARKLQPDDPSLVWAQAQLLASQPKPNRPLAAKALATLLASPNDLGLKLAANLQLRRGLAWQVEEAEDLLRDFAAQHKTAEAQFVWLRWLQSRGRLDEALAVIDRLGKQYPDRKPGLELYRAQLLLARGQSEEAGKLITALQAQKPGLEAEILDVIYLARTGSGDQAEKKIADLVGRHENNGLLYFWQGQLARQRGDFAQAARAYGRSVQFTRIKGPSQNGLLLSLLGLAQKESPVVAFELTQRLLQSNEREPALLLAYAELARQLDNIYGKEGMEGALKGLEAALREQDPASAQGAYLSALMWNSAGRPDIALNEARRALQAKPDHQQALALAINLELGDEQWDAALAHLETLEKLQPDNPDVKLWRAAAYRGQGKPDEAERVYRDFVARYPDRVNGYLGLAELLEKSKKYDAALKEIARWQKRFPDDLNGVQAEIRLLCASGHVEQAVRRADTFLTEQLKKLEAQIEGAQAKLPPAKDDKEKEQRARNARLALLNGELLVALAVGSGFQNARAFDPALTWAERALGLTEKAAAEAQAGAPEDKRPRANAAALNLQLLLGSIYLERSKGKKGDDRKADVDKAIEAFQKVWKQSPGQFVAGNNLAWLQNEERKQPQAAYAIVQEVRKGRFSGRPLSGDRLNLNFLDTLGVIYRAAERPQEAVAVFKEAAQRYTREPQVFLHLADSYAALAQKGDKEALRGAFQSYNKAIELAVARAERAGAENNPERKKHFDELAEKARKGQQELQKPRQ
ncbi:MAG TPA: tetratricopeptide repeat protein [Gemmataceae bacterium]|nr:tetratricopeptide repeat protein [Gemmataceae bacterium]